jgi:hypothetical protein
LKEFAEDNLGVSPCGNTFEREGVLHPYGSQNNKHRTIMRAASGARNLGRKIFVMPNQRLAASMSARASAVAMAFAALATPAAALSDNPFVTLAGTWSGSGTARFDNGKTESLRCRGYYTNNGNPHNLGLSIRCANASAKIELRASLVDSHGSVSGSWEERTYNQSGTVTGRATANRMTLAISGGINGSMTVAISGGKHSVTVATSGPSFKGVNISMSR